jgi:hypothetical protein
MFLPPILKDFEVNHPPNWGYALNNGLMNGCSLNLTQEKALMRYGYA